MRLHHRQRSPMIGPTYAVTTDCFAIEPGEDETTNPGIYGKQFAAWIAERLRARGEGVAGVVAEDFGWCVMLGSEPVRRWIACGNRAESATEWLAYVVAEPTLLQRLIRRVDARPEVARLSTVLESILREVPNGSGHAAE
jgi:hypothetical protein